MAQNREDVHLLQCRTARDDVDLVDDCLTWLDADLKLMADNQVKTQVGST